MSVSADVPQVYVLVSGKRCSGKDFFGSLLARRVNATLGRSSASIVCRLGDAVKRAFAIANDLDFERLISMERGDRDYKEAHREELTQFYITQRPSLEWLVGEVVSQAAATPTDALVPPSVVIITDIRHPKEIETIQAATSSPIITVRVTATDATKTTRGWVYDEDKDTSVTETGLDSKSDWDVVAANDADGEGFLLEVIDNTAIPLIVSALFEPTVRLPSGDNFASGSDNNSPTPTPTPTNKSEAVPAVAVAATTPTRPAVNANLAAARAAFAAKRASDSGSEAGTPTPASPSTSSRNNEAFTARVLAAATEPRSPLFRNADGVPRTTKIVASLGPTSWPDPVLTALISAGVDIVRLNCSHRQEGAFEEMIPRLREKGGVQILGDLQGPKFRVSSVTDGEVVLQEGKFVQLALMKNYKDITTFYRITLSDTTEQRALLTGLADGMDVLLDDGKIVLRVLSRKSDTQVKCEVIVGGPLHSHKGVNVPQLTTRLPCLTEKDLVDLAFMLDAGVDYLALSFVQGPEDIEQLISEMDKAGVAPADRPKIIPKIEKPRAVETIDEILALCDGLMVARGDLGVEVGLAAVPRIQKELISKANAAGKFVITATQMLETMTENTVPTRAEVSDVANAVLDGTDAVMLSGESASGAHPVLAVAAMASIIVETEGGWPSE